MGPVTPPPQQGVGKKADEVAPGTPKETFGLGIHEPHEAPPVDAEHGVGKVGQEPSKRSSTMDSMRWWMIASPGGRGPTARGELPG